MLLEGLSVLVKDAEKYLDQVATHPEVRIGFKLTDTGEEATLFVSGVLSVSEGLLSPALLITLTSEDFKKILEGEADAAALMARSSMGDVRPIGFEVVEKDREAAVWEALKSLMDVFFIPGRLKSKRLAREYAGEAHGAHPIPVAYWNGIRLA